MDRNITLLVEKIRDVALFHWFKGVLSKNTLGHRNPVDVVCYLQGDPVHSRKRRNKEDCFFSAAIQGGAEFSTDVSPQSRVCLFIDASDFCLSRPAYDL